MSSVTETSLAKPAGWAEAARLIRRVCILQATGRLQEAAELESTAIAEALELLQATFPNRLEGENAVRALREREDERIANAVALAEVLAPLLLKSLSPLTGSALAKPAGGPASFSSARPAHPRGTPREIADFIDEMIAQTTAKQLTQ